MKRIFVFLFLIYWLAGNVEASTQLSVSKNYWIQVFATSSQESIDRFLGMHPGLSTYEVINENSLFKLLVGPFGSHAEARGKIANLDDVKGAFVKYYEMPELKKDDSTESQKIVFTSIEILPKTDSDDLNHNEINSDASSNVFSKLFDFLSTKETNDTVVAVSDLEDKDEISSNFITFLETATENDISVIDVTPWGQNHEIMAKEVYYSGMGRKCRKLKLLHGRKDLPEYHYMCEKSDNEWEAIRCISR